MSKNKYLAFLACLHYLPGPTVHILTFFKTKLDENFFQNVAAQIDAWKTEDYDGVVKDMQKYGLYAGLFKNQYFSEDKLPDLFPAPEDNVIQSGKIAALY